MVPLLGKRFKWFLKNLNIDRPYVPEIPLLGLHLGKLKVSIKIIHVPDT